MNLNVAPYNDDFSEDKNFYKVLFKPGYEVQSRELNTLQSILQNQISSIGNHLFKNGSKISGCSTAFVQYNYVRLDDTFDSIDLNLIPYNNTSIKLVGEVSEVEARIIDVSNKQDGNPPTLYVIYTKTGIDNEQNTFIPGETINFINEDDVIVYHATVKCPTCPGNNTTDIINPNGFSLFFNAGEGIFYYNGYFVRTQTQHIIVDPYLIKDEKGVPISDKTYQVGLKVIERIVTVEDDESLYDNHLGYPNYAEEGADRLKIDLDLSMVEYNDDQNTDFIVLAKVRQNHTVEYKKDDTDYNEIMKELARRTYETSGNFTSIAWKTQFLNEKKATTTDNNGWSLTGKDENFTTILSPGTGYVKGYRASTIADTIVPGRKARDTNKLRGAAITFNDRPYITVTATGNIPWLNHSGPSTLSNQTFNLVDVTDATIGSFKCYDIYKIAANTYKIYLYDITMVGTKPLSLATKVTLSDGSFTSDIVVNTTLQSANNATLLFPLSYTAIKSIRDNDNDKNGNTTVELRKRLIGVLDGAGSITFNTITNEFFVSPFTSNPICWVGSNPTAVNVGINNTNAVATSSTLTLNLGTGNAGKSVTYIGHVTRTSQTEKTKTLTRHTYTTNAKPSSEMNSVIELPFVDGYRLESVKLISIADSGINEDITSEYVFNNGQTENFYNPATITRNVIRPFDTDNRLIITFYYFEHSGTAGYFTVDSYSQLVNDPDLNLEYSDIPRFTDKNGNVYKLAECVDFRSIKSGSTGVDNKSILPSFNSTMVYDVEYYLGRADLLQVNKDGQFYYKEGIPSDYPVLPTPDENAMPLYEVHLNPYVYDLNDIKIKYIDNKRFTMADISKIEKRIGNLEYAVALSLLEQQTLNMSIKDQNGLDRYKNGFLVDNFKNYNGSDLKHPEYKASIDRTQGIVRPQFKQNNVKLSIDIANSNNIKKLGNIVTTNYTHDLFINNSFATQSLSINPYLIFRKEGTLSLSPNIDTWSDEEVLPRVVTNIDAGVDALKDIANSADLLTTEYGAWTDYNTSVIGTSTSSVTANSTIVSDSRKITSNITSTTTSTSTTTRTDSSRDVTTKAIGSKTQSYNIDDIVKDVSIIPMIRSKTIQFYATNMKPNTRLYAYFDGVNVTQHCKPIMQVVSDASNAIFGATPLLTDLNGNLSGEFRIPANTFFTGEKKFVLTNDVNNSGNPDIETSRSESTYFAGGISQTKQSSTLNIVTPTFTTNTTTENKSRTSTSVSRETNTTTVDIPFPVIVEAPRTPPVVVPITQPTVPSRNFGWSSLDKARRRFSGDPIAQAFKVDESCFISKFGVYFSSIGNESDTVWFEIREMINGYPSTENIAHKEVKSSTLLPFVSTDASKEYIVEFSAPVYVDASKSYCIVIGGYSPETRVYISKLGDKLIGTANTYLETPPLTYTMFRSLNGETWNAEQFDTLKFNLYRCVFDTSGTTVRFNANNNFKINCDVAPIEVQTGSNQVRVYAKNHGLMFDDRVVLDFNKDVYYKIELTTGIPVIGQKITTSTGEGIVKDILYVGSDYQICLEDVVGVFELDQVFNGESRQYEYNDIHVIDKMNANGSAITINVSSGIIKEVITTSMINNISGAALSLFAKQHIVKAVDSIDTFIIEVTGTYSSSGRFGGASVVLSGNNINYNMINVSGQYLSYNAVDSWTLKGYNPTSNILSDIISIVPSADNYMDVPKSIISSRNETRVLGTDKSFTFEINSNLRSKYIAPVINIDSFSAILVSNRIESINEASYDILPNIGRFVEETEPTNGSEKYKHITTLVRLENPAIDMRIMFDVLTTNNSDFDVYVKLIKAQDNDETTINWLKIDKYDKKRSNNIDTMEYDLSLSDNCTGWDDNVEYISYRVKLVGRSTNTSQPVIFRNFRAIAIT